METYRIIKFGGSNLNTSLDVEKISNVLEFYEQPVISVVSAFSGVTDQLEEVIKYSGNVYNAGKKLINYLWEYKSGIIDELIPDSRLKEDMKGELRARLESLEKSIFAVHCIGSLPDFLEDEILSYGERLSSLILSGFLRSRDFNCKELLPGDIPFVTDGVYGKASVDCELSSSAVQAKLDGSSFVIPGFYGVSRQGKTTVLGRGGSDYAAACLANCINAESLDVWKDVNGFMSADPEIIDFPSELEILSYDEASEIACFGSEILHPRTAEPLRGKNIPIKMYNICECANWPEPHTFVTQEGSVSSQIIKSISLSNSFAIIRLSGAGVGVKPGVLAHITHIFDHNRINIKSVLTSQIAINLLLEDEDLKDALNLLKDADIKAVEDISVVDDISVIAAVGEGLVNYEGIASDIFTAVAEKGINVQLICFGASSVALYFVVNHTDRLEAVKAIHNYFFIADEKKCTDNNNISKSYQKEL
jgi:aspartate kinase/aspartokinase/homoserine dehydrogenase 1